MTHAISWFELPAIDLERAIAFYDTVLGTKLDEITGADDGATPCSRSMTG